ncbi:outer membrane beta-barrel protein [Mucilaginibacter angelicae]|uniref:Outer membrane beta-barrel protein n=1 Tax=Mucilaginibacter angelicae TaxID=869718 RepID=A0ABV6L7D4_9SPHI
MRPLYILLFFVIYGSFAYAQGNILGKINDDKNLPVAGAIVRLQKLPDTAIYKVLTTDTSGRFIFKDVFQGNYLLKISLVGYQSSKLLITCRDSLTDAGVITLKSAVVQLHEVSIQAKTPLIEKQIDRTVVNVDQNIANTGTNALELLKKLPGVQVTPDGQVTLNGKSGVNVTIDGRTTFLSADDLANLLTNTPSSDIQKIEIMTNPSAKYDAGGTGGIINIIRKKNTKSGFNGNVTAGTGLGPHYSRYNSSLVLNFKTDKYNLYLNNSYGYSNGYTSSYGTSDIMNGNALASEQNTTNQATTINKAYNSSAGIDLYLSKKATLTLTGSVSDRSSNNNLTSILTTADSNRVKTGSENFNALNIDKPLNFTTGIQLLHKPDTTIRAWSVDVDYSDYRYRPGQYNTGLNYDPSGFFLNRSNVFIDEMRTLHILGARTDYVMPLPGNGKIEAGLKSSYVKTLNNSIYYNQVNGLNVADPSQSDDNVNSENINAAYINFNRQYKKIAVQAGLRAEQTQMDGKQLNNAASFHQNYFGLFPTVFVNDKIDERNTLNFQFGKRIDRPDYHELVPFRRPLSATLSFQGNPNLKPDINWHSELTWSWKNTFFVTAAYDLDHNYLRTLYYLDSNKTTITRMPTNIPLAQSWNVDLSFNKVLVKWFTTNTTATFYQNLFNGTANNGFSFDDPGFVTLDLVTNNSFRCSDNLSLEADFEYESRRQFVGSIFGAYSVLSLAAKQKLFHGQGSLTLNANNILNTESRGSSDRYLNLIQHGYSYVYSRAFLLTFNYRFGSGKLAKTQSKSGSEEEQKRAGN